MTDIIKFSGYFSVPIAKRIAAWAGDKRIYIDLCDGKLKITPSRGNQLTLDMPPRATLKDIAMEVARMTGGKHVDFWDNQTSQGFWRAEIKK